MEETTPLEEYRCQCGKLLFKGHAVQGTIEIKCKSCREVLQFKHQSQ